MDARAVQSIPRRCLYNPSAKHVPVGFSQTSSILRRQTTYKENRQPATKGPDQMVQSAQVHPSGAVDGNPNIRYSHQRQMFGAL